MLSTVATIKRDFRWFVDKRSLESRDMSQYHRRGFIIGPLLRRFVSTEQKKK